MSGRMNFNTCMCILVTPSSDSLDWLSAKTSIQIHELAVYSYIRQTLTLVNESSLSPFKTSIIVQLIIVLDGENK